MRRGPVPAPWVRSGRESCSSRWTGTAGTALGNWFPCSWCLPLPSPLCPFGCWLLLPAPPVAPCPQQSQMQSDLCPAKFPASLCKRLRAAPLAASARTCLSDVPHAPLWWWNSSGSPTGSPCAPALFLPSHYKVFLTISATVVPVSPSQCPGLCHCGRISLEVSHKSHSSLLLEISHLFSCSQPAHLWDGPASCCRDVSPWKLSGTSQGAGHSHFVDRGVVQQRCACPGVGAGVLQDRSRGCCATQGSQHSCHFFPRYQCLSVCSHRSLENPQEAGLSAIRLQLFSLQGCLQQEFTTFPSKILSGISQLRVLHRVAGNPVNLWVN